MAGKLVNTVIMGAALAAGAVAILWASRQLGFNPVSPTRLANAFQGQTIPHPIDYSIYPGGYGYDYGVAAGLMPSNIRIHELQSEHMANTLPPIEPQLLREVPDWVERRMMSTRWVL